MDVNQRERIQTSEEFVKFIAECKTKSSRGIPQSPQSNQLFVFNEDSSPTNLPEFHALKFNFLNNRFSIAPSSSASNRSQKAASECDSNSCVFCGYSDHSKKIAAHIFEIDA